MPACTNDLTPIITAISVIIAVQVPIIVAFLMNMFKAQRDARTLKDLGFSTKQKVEELTMITTNGFHGPKGDTGDQGAPGRDAPNATEEKPAQM